jgi:DNA-nicking Smr family endonuclease
MGKSEDDNNKLLEQYLEEADWERIIAEKKTKASSTTKRKNSKKSKSLSIDLHGLVLTEAKTFLDNKLISILKSGKPSVTLTIITGKGLHSKEGKGVLCSEIHRYVEERYAKSIVSIDESPDNLRINGVPLRGFFQVTFKNK